MILEKNELIEECREMREDFITPSDWNPKKVSQRIYLPEYMTNEINAISLIMGSGGRTQKLLE